MDIKKAIEEIDMFHGFSKEGNEAVDIAIKALKKQMPKKAEIDEDVSVRYEPVRICPACGGKFLGNVAKYCYRCGQAVEYDTED